MHRAIRASASNQYRRCLPQVAAALVLAALAIAASVRASAQTPPPTAARYPTPSGNRIELSAGRVTYYSDRFLLTGEDDVRLRLADGTTVRGSLFSMDLKLNRLLVAGGVHVTYGGRTIDGAAFATFLDFKRSYFVPILSEPDRWTFIGSDYEHPLLGREMPGDTFFIPDTAHQHVFLFAKAATIVPKQSVYFRGVQINTLGTFAPLPTYFLSFSTNPNFGANSLAGAYVDAPVPFAGSSNSLETAHLRYDSINKLYGSYEQHLVADNAYLVGSINPVTRPQKQYNLTGTDHLTPWVQVGTFMQESAFQHGFGQRLSASGFDNVTVTAGLHNSYVQAYANFYYTSLLPQPKPGVGGALYYGDPSHPWEPDHPANANFGWNGFDHKASKLPLYFRLRSGLGFAHDPYVAEAFLGGTFYPTIWYNYVGGTAWSPSFKLGGGFYLNGVFDKQRTSFSLPHHFDSTTTNVSLSRGYGTKLAQFVAYVVTAADDYWGARQLEVYTPLPPNYVIPFTLGPISQIAPDYLTFRGLATYRSLVESTVFTPNPYFQASFLLRQSRDYPQPIAPTCCTYLYGRPPYQADMDVRFRIYRTLVLDVGRSYFFNYGNLRWSPTFAIRTGP
jgi:hypothetical protein